MDAAIRLLRQPFARTQSAAPAATDLEASTTPVASSKNSVLSGPYQVGKTGLEALEAAFLGRTEPVTGVLTGLHTVSMVAREAIPAYVASPVMGVVGAMTKLAASVGGAHAAKLTTDWSTQAVPQSELSPTYQILWTLLPRTAGVGLTLAALVSFPAAEAAALSVAALGQAAQSSAQDHGVSRWKRNVLAVACQAAVLFAREGAFNASTNFTNRAPASPYSLSAAACNGAAENCAAQWCDVVFPATHNSAMQPTPFAHLGWPVNQLGRFASNQASSIETQFADGIRGFLIEYYQNDHGDLRTSHNTVFDREPLEKTLGRFATLLANNPRDFITLKLSQQQKGDYHDKLVNLYQQSGLASKSMQDTCQKGGQSAVSAPPCRLSMGSLLDLGVQVATVTGALENKYDANTLAQMDCKVNGLVQLKSGTTIVNNTQYDTMATYYVDGEVDYFGAKIAPVTWNAFVSLAMPSVSAVVNGYLPNFVAKCAGAQLTDVGTPTLLAVNHYESSDVVAVAHALNTQSYKRKGDEAVCGITPNEG